MKQFILLLFLQLTLGIYAKDIDLKTNITDVTVFQSGAQVKRQGQLKLPAGESLVKVSDATSLLKKESIQVKGEGNFTIIYVNYEVKLEDVDDEKASWKGLEEKQKVKMEELQALSVKIQILNAQENTILNLKNTSTQTKGGSVEQVVKAQETVKAKLYFIKSERLKLYQQVIEKFDDYKKLSQRLVALKSPKKNVKYEIVIKVSAKAETQATFFVNYVVPNAKWFPTYDLRVNSINQPLSIEYKANVSQESGEDWTNVNLKLSTGDPSQNMKKPVVDPWWLYLNSDYIIPFKQASFYKYTDARFYKVTGIVVDEESGDAVPWTSIMVSGSSVGTMADENGNFELVLPENAKQLNIYSIGYTSKAIIISEKNIAVKLKKEEKPLHETVKTDYDKQLMTVQSPLFEVPQLVVGGGLYDKIFGVDAPAGQYSQSDALGYSSSLNYNYNTAANVSISESRVEYSSKRSGKKTAMAPAYDVKANKTINIVNAEYAIEEKYTILSDPKNISVTIQRINTSATYQYYCAPRYDKDVFIIAKITDWDKYNLLEGQANVFLEGTFIGNTLFDTRFLVDTLEIALGRDKNISVERKKSKDYTKHQIAGNDNIVYKDWDITVKSIKQQPIDIIIEDQVPVTADSKIVITKEEISNASMDEKTGIVTWKFQVPSMETKKLKFKYKVKYPKGYFVGLD